MGEPIEVLPDFYWLRMPLPYALDHVNLWLIRDGSSWDVIDTGHHDQASIAIWTKLLSDFLSPTTIGRIVLTHFHPDHSGMAGWLVEETRAALLMNRTEWLTGSFTRLGPPEAARMRTRDFYHQAGFPIDARIDQLDAFLALIARIQALPQPYQPVRHGDRVRLGRAEWIAIVTPGHSPGHLCLYSPEHRALIGGDQLLPRITPNISVSSWEPDSDPLGDFLASFQDLETLPEDTLVLPSHGLPYIGLKNRIWQLRLHHEERLAKLAQTLSHFCTAFEAVPLLFPKPLAGNDEFLALGETLAHLNHLVASGGLQSAVGADGLRRFNRSNTPMPVHTATDFDLSAAHQAVHEDTRGVQTPHEPAPYCMSVSRRSSTRR
jgi:glyoxylase-like metal-dependent hydrolase (beta-lactamase superfamily II)